MSCAEIKAVYREDMQERNLLAQSGRRAAYKTHKIVAPTKPVPSPTYEMNINKPMKWEDFKRLPSSMQKLYLETIMKEYKPAVSAIAEMFGVNKFTLYSNFERLGIPTGGRKGKNDSKRFLEVFCKPEEPEVIETTEVVTEIPVEDETPAMPDAVEVFDTETVNELDITFIQHMSEKAIGNFLKAILSSKSTVKLVWTE